MSFSLLLRRTEQVSAQMTLISISQAHFRKNSVRMRTTPASRSLPAQPHSMANADRDSARFKRRFHTSAATVYSDDALAIESAKSPLLVFPLGLLALGAICFGIQKIWNSLFAGHVHAQP